MRLHCLEECLQGESVSDIRRVLTYRSEFFGTPMSILTQAVLRGPSYWSVGERELFAAFTSSLNRCPF
ncbi:hypothetical protein KSZ_28250 [Dictyobacter formicarum]|uniref:Carboxymuconolactone decarboxylase-like domain-containing protein n=3 Tax=Dictyobacter formicarum TaxID=2778368 RepID=A0ABQ3VGJ1_9CHLR|nr:hypothetical protein KSZ_28250 [Dictyobacter formicarum]